VRAQPKIKLADWAARNWSPPPCRRTLHRWAQNAQIDPPPQLVGHTYYVEPNARYVDRNGNVTS